MIKMQKPESYIYKEIEYELLPISDVTENDIQREINHLGEKILERTALFSRINGKESYISKLANNTPVVNMAKKKIKYFKQNRYIIGQGVHSIFPYQGKSKPWLVKFLLNSLGSFEKINVFDPMCGSGTTLIESILGGHNAYGTDISAFGQILSTIKLNALKGDKNDIVEFNKIISRYSSYEINPFKNINDMERLGESIPYDLFILTVINSIGYNKRRSKYHNSKFGEQLQFISQQTSNFLNCYYETRDKYNFNFGDFQVFKFDARKIIFKQNSMDLVVTSPPYLDTIDYPVRDNEILHFLNENPIGIRSQVIGTQGTLHNKIISFFQGMIKVAENISNVLKPDSKAIIIVGNYSISENKRVLLTHLTETAMIMSGFSLEKTRKFKLNGYNNFMETEIVQTYRLIE